MRQSRWVMKQVEESMSPQDFSRDLNNLPVELATSLLLRGIDSISKAKFFFRAGLSDLHDPYLMKGMQEAVERIDTALQSGERIIVYGDYDVDGTTSTAVLTSFLRTFSGSDSGSRESISFFIPNRHIHGYGLSRAGIDVCAENMATLIVALDCGVTSVDEIAYAGEKGIDVIVCDHHTPLDELPDAVAVLDPKQSDCPYPFKELCGCGVTYKLVQALLVRQNRDPEEAEVYLDLVALATASDIVSVTGENRILLREGLIRLRQNSRRGLRFLAMEARTKLSESSSSSILFTIGPRINAAGRLGEADRAVHLLLSETDEDAATRAKQLEEVNKKRREIDRETQQTAFKMAERKLTSADLNTLVLYNPEWNVGVIGIVASRLVDRFYRPTILLTSVNGIVKGSCRSVNGVSVFEALRDCQDLLTDFGGHTYAAGVTLLEENVPAFTKRFEEAVSKRIGPELLDPILEVDTEMSLSSLTERFWAVLKQFEPFGPDNKAPVFWAKNLLLTGRPKAVGHERTHLKFSVIPKFESAKPRDVIGFRMSDKMEMLLTSKTSGEPIDLLFSVQENTWNGRTTIQLRALDVRLSSSSFPSG
ncbi:MAG: single-stranded-DNA-specific exonuclease RecJ [Bacteroidetes bacterium]|nr:MAG: single-stranded-DNA-specific exonuclease RecJ [Bacteroidota bacterium]